MSSYSYLPTHFQWLKDSFVLIGSRAEDSVLTRIDNLVSAINNKKAEGESWYLYGELFFATNYWLRNFKLNPKMKPEREPAVRSLFVFVTNKLARHLGCGTAQALPNKLEELYGKGLTDHGRHQDSEAVLGSHHYMERGETNKFRVHFRQGKAYQFEWRVQNPRLLPANSEKWSNLTPDAGKKKDGVMILENGWSYFVMSMSRDIYIGPHMSISKGSAQEGQVGVVHSSWLAGLPVQCSGSLLIEEGYVKGIRNNSGHYHPTDNHMVNVLELLQTVGVDINKVEVYDYSGKQVCDPVTKQPLSGAEFLKERGSWDNILKRKGMDLKQPGTKPAAPPVTTPGVGAKLKKKYRCGNCNKIYEESYTVSFCQYCHGACVPV
jgi:hypothetical protein